MHLVPRYNALNKCVMGISFRNFSNENFSSEKQKSLTEVDMKIFGKLSKNLNKIIESILCWEDVKLFTHD